MTKVVWIKDGTDVTTLTDGTTYTPDTGGGSYDNNTGTQTSTLTVSGSDQDRLTFSCNVTDPSDGSTTGSGSVLLWFYGKPLVKYHLRNFRRQATVFTAMSIESQYVEYFYFPNDNLI